MAVLLKGSGTPGFGESTNTSGQRRYASVSGAARDKVAVMAIVRACHKHARISATKVRPFADMIRGKTVEEGLNALKYLPNRGARVLEQVLQSARANAEDRGARNVDHLPIVEARVDGGPMFKRLQPRARGMAFLIRRRFSHVHVAIEAPEIG